MGRFRVHEAEGGDGKFTDKVQKRRGLGPFTGGQLAAIIIVVVIAVGFPIGAFATLSFSNVSITDPHGANRAFVNSSGQLETHVGGAVQPAPPTHAFSASGFTPDATGPTNRTGIRLRCTTSPCRIAITDVVLSQDNTSHVSMGAIVKLRTYTGDATCKTAGADIRPVFPHVYIPAGQTTTINLLTPVVATVSPLCFDVLTDFPAGYEFRYTVNGYWVSP